MGRTYRSSISKFLPELLWSVIFLKDIFKTDETCETGEHMQESAASVAFVNRFSKQDRICWSTFIAFIWLSDSHMMHVQNSELDITYRSMF